MGDFVIKKLVPPKKTLQGAGIPSHFYLMRPESGGWIRLLGCPRIANDANAPFTPELVFGGGPPNLPLPGSCRQPASVPMFQRYKSPGTM